LWDYNFVITNSSVKMPPLRQDQVSLYGKGDGYIERERTATGIDVEPGGAAWAWHLTWLLLLTLAIGSEETLESSMVIFALRRGRRLEMRKVSGPATPFSNNQSIKPTAP